MRNIVLLLIVKTAVMLHQTGMCQWSTSTFKNSCGCTALDMLEWMEMTEQTDWRTKQPSQKDCVLEDLKCWGTWDSTCRHTELDITPSISWRRETWKEQALDDLPWKDERGPSSIRWTLEPFQRQRCGNFWDGIFFLLLSYKGPQPTCRLFWRL